MKGYRFYEPMSPEWDEAWRGLHERFGSVDEICPCCGEAWQYMGTVDGHHEFRHRHHPETGERMYHKVQEVKK